MKRAYLNYVFAVLIFGLGSMAGAAWLGEPDWNADYMVTSASSSFSESMGPIQTVWGYPGSFDYIGGFHTNEGTGYGMWMSASGGGGGVSNPSPSGEAAPAWIAYDLGRVYQLASLKVWNYNQNAGSGLGLGRGFKDVKINVSSDGQTWTTAYDGILSKASGAIAMPCTDVIDLACIDAQYVVINAYSHWNDDGSGNYYGLSEVRFNLSGEIAMNPSPKDGAADTLRNMVLAWRPGIYAAKAQGHDVYFGTSEFHISNASRTSSYGVYKGRQDVNSFDTGLLTTGLTYYWRIDEVNNSNTWKGEVWKFSVDPGTCTSPYPADKKVDLPRNAILEWEKGVFAGGENGNDIYFGSSFEDVNNATALSASYKGRQDANCFNPGMLNPGNKYYWRADAVNGPEVWKGQTWSFKVRRVVWGDFAAVCSRWLWNGCGYPEWCEGGDFDYSGGVDFADYSTFAGYWQRRPVKIMPLGDSITRGLTTGPWVPGGYRTKLYNRLSTELYDVDFVGTANDNPDPEGLADSDHEGHGGYRIDQISASIIDWVNQCKPDIVLVHIGTNDVAQNYFLSVAQNRLDSLITKIATTSPGTDIIVAQIITSTDATEASQIATYNSKIPAVVSAHAAAGQKVHIVNMNGVVGLSQFYDTYHPGKEGYDAMADAWFEKIRQVRPVQ